LGAQVFSLPPNEKTAIMKTKLTKTKKGRIVVSPNLTKISVVIDRNGRITKSTTTNISSEKVKKEQ